MRYKEIPKFHLTSTNILQILISIQFMSQVQSLEIYQPKDLQERADKCTICKDIEKKFQEGLVNTSKGNFGGGNTMWEKKSLGKYAHSETRLIEILENLCDNSNRECHHMVETNEEKIEDYWSDIFPSDNGVDFYKWFCIENIKVCCPSGMFGANCIPCYGGAKRPCSGNGYCDGDGTREGNGMCSCHEGYTDVLCNKCQDGYFTFTKNETHITCLPCDDSCVHTCSKAGPLGCEQCKKGYRNDTKAGCTDIDECSERGDDSACKDGTYCKNTPGSYECTKCKDGCLTCTSADQCLTCAEGYQLDQSGLCIDIDECAAGDKCIGDNETCENTEGTFFCGCVDGFVRSNDACILKNDEIVDETSEKSSTNKEGDVVKEEL